MTMLTWVLIAIIFGIAGILWYLNQKPYRSECSALIQEALLRLVCYDDRDRDRAILLFCELVDFSECLMHCRRWQTFEIKHYTRVIARKKSRLAELGFWEVPNEQRT